MTTARIEKILGDARRSGRGALLPYLTAGFPDLEATAELIRRADALGSAVIEIGIPYSDSIADGPVIQSSFSHVLARGQTVADVFGLVGRVRPEVNCAIVAMVSYSVVHRTGLQMFMDQAAGSGFDGVILPDVPLEESAPTSAAAAAASLGYIGLVSPTASAARRAAVARQSTGFIYQIAVAGTTGERTAISSALPEVVGELRSLSDLPVCVGFGISNAQHVRAVCEYADGAVVGSAIVRRVADGINSGLPREALINSVADFIAELMTGTATGEH